MIYKRFTEKAAEEWRQIYKVSRIGHTNSITQVLTRGLKALQLLEFLIKNGSERVIDDARSHLSLLKMLRQFHYIDPNGKDQGVNVRNRSKELADLLGDVDRIRAERKKARANRNKFGGVSGGAMSSGLSSGSRYGGFGSEDGGGYGGYSGGVYGDGGGFGGNTSGFQDTSSRRDRFEEYDEYDEGAVANPGRRKADSASSARRETKKTEPPKKKEPEVDILAFDDDIPPETPPKELASNGKKAASNPMDDGFGALQAGGADEDDFDDFQSAAPTTQTASNPSIPGLLSPTPRAAPLSTTQFAAPKPVSASQSSTLDDLVGFNTISPTPSTATMMSPPASNYNVPSTSAFTSPPPSAFASPSAITQQQSKPTSYQATTPNYFTSVPVAPSPASQPSSAMGGKPSMGSSTFNKPAQTKSSSAGGDVFGSLWSTASATAGIKSTSTPGNSGPKLADMAKEKASAGIWGANAPSTSAAQPQSQRPLGQAQGGGQKVGGGLDDLLG